jgi:hypothetical protein
VDSYLLPSKANPNAKSSKLVSSPIHLEFYHPQLPTQRKAQAQSQLWAIKKMISRKLRVFVIYYLFLYFLPFSVLRSSTISLFTKGKRAKMKTNATLYTCYILIDVAYCRNLKFMGDIVN